MTAEAVVESTWTSVGCIDGMGTNGMPQYEARMVMMGSVSEVFPPKTDFKSLKTDPFLTDVNIMADTQIF